MEARLVLELKGSSPYQLVSEENNLKVVSPNRPLQSDSPGGQQPAAAA
jgi:hypothetical protein